MPLRSLVHAVDRLTRDAWLLWRTERRLRRAGSPAERLGLLSAGCAGMVRAHDLRIDAGSDRAAATLPQPCIVVANHLSYVDPLVLMAQHPLVPMSKAEVAGWPAFGTIMRLAGALFIERGNSMDGFRVLRQTLRLLRDGVSVLCFPEGTTTDASEVLAFHRGIFGIAQKSGVPVVPVAIHYQPRSVCWFGNVTFLPHFLRLAALPSIVARVQVLAPVMPRPGETAADFAARVRDSVVAAKAMLS